MSELPVRKEIRLKDYNYSSAGYYFITICTKDRQEMLGKIVVGAHSVRPCTYPCARPHEVELSEIGAVIDVAIRNINEIYQTVTVNKYVIMPNHIHMILVVADTDGRTMCAPTISRVVKQCKEYVTKQIGFSIWQRSYHDHIIRNEADYKRIWQYIDENPARWDDDEYNT